jgi:hypothetical protein
MGSLHRFKVGLPVKRTHSVCVIELSWKWRNSRECRKRFAGVFQERLWFWGTAIGFSAKYRLVTSRTTFQNPELRPIRE